MAEKVKKWKLITSKIELIKQIDSNVTKNINSFNNHQVKLYLNELIELYKDFIKAQDQYEVLLTDDEYNQDTNRHDMAEIYFKLRPILETSLEKFVKPKLEATITNPTSTPKLPEITIPPFDGTFSKWSDFIDSFTSIIHNNTSLSSSLKFQYLKNLLKGRALSAISDLDVTNENYLKAIKQLEERFNNVKFICEEHISAMFSCKRIEKATSSNLLEMLDKFKSHLHSLNTMKRPTAHWDDLIVYLFTSKLDNDTLSKWIDTAPSDRMASFEELSTFLITHSHKLEIQPQVKVKPSSSSSTKNLPFSASRRIQQSSFVSIGEKYHCSLCERNE